MSVVRPAVSDIITVNSKKFVPTDGCCLILIIPVLLSRVNVSKKINNTLINVLYLNIHYIVKPAHLVTSIKQSPVSKDHLFLVLS